MRSIVLLLLTSSLPLQAFTDTIDHYIHISSSIPTMEMRADPDAQAWAHSARNVLTITNESIAETLTEANSLAKNQGKPLFCLPPSVELNAEKLKLLIEQAYQTMPRIQNDKDKITVSQVAWMAVLEQYPCDKPMKKTSAAAPSVWTSNQQG